MRFLENSSLIGSSGRMLKLFCIFLITVFFVFSQDSLANIGEAYGFGSRIASLAGAGVAWGGGAYSAYHNPALLALESEKKLFFDWSIVYSKPKFKPIQGILVQNKFVADSPQYGNVDNDSYRETLGQELGLSYRIFPEIRNITVGLVTFFPLSQFAYMDTGEAYVPEYVLYRTRTQRPQIELGLGGYLGKGFYLGVGVHFAYTLTSNSSIFINSGKSTTSSMRFAASLRPKPGFYSGILYIPEKVLKKFSIGAVFRQAVASDNSMNLNSAARIIGSFPAIDFNFSALSVLYYDPMTIELGSSWQYSDTGRLYVQLEYQFWSQFQAPSLLIHQPQTKNCGSTDPQSCGTVAISPGQIPDFQYRNLWVPRIGWEYAPADGQIVYRMGYAFRDSFLVGLPTGNGNYLDPPKHMFNLGIGLNYSHFMGYDAPCRLDFNLSYQYLLTQHIVKTPGNEVGDPPDDSKIGSPEYFSGGSVYGGGMTLSLGF